MRTQLQFYERVNVWVGSVHVNGSLRGRVRFSVCDEPASERVKSSAHKVGEMLEKACVIKC